MDARINRAVVLTAVLLVSMGARHRSANFIVETPDPRLALSNSPRPPKNIAMTWPSSGWASPCPTGRSLAP